MAYRHRRTGRAKRFGFITTNSIKQTFNRRVLEAHHTPSPAGSGGKGALALALAIPVHPWVDATDGTAVRIAMTDGYAPRPRRATE